MKAVAPRVDDVKLDDEALPPKKRRRRRGVSDPAVGVGWIGWGGAQGVEGCRAGRGREEEKSKRRKSKRRKSKIVKRRRICPQNLALGLGGNAELTARKVKAAAGAAARTSAGRSCASVIRPLVTSSREWVG